MNEAIVLLIALPIGIALLTGFFATIGVLFPSAVGAAQQIIATTPGRATLIGVVNLLFFGLLALASFAIGDQSGLPVLALPGLLIAAILVILLCFGLTAIVEQAGERLLPTGAGLWRTLIGTTVVGLGCAMPFVGWFLLLPYLGLLGLGAQIIYLIGVYRGQTLP